MRKLTDRQVAVLAAMERRGGRVRLPWFAWEEFPELTPSAVLSVLKALERHGRIISYGDRSLVYCGKVTFAVVGSEAIEEYESALDKLLDMAKAMAARKDVAM